MLADEGFTDAPDCASPIIRRYTIRLNDKWDDEKRQQLKPYLVRMIGTGSDGKDEVRREILRRELMALASPWLRLAGLPEAADRLVAAKTDAELNDALEESSQVLGESDEKRLKLAERIKAELKKRDAAASVDDAIDDAIVDAVVDAIAVIVVDAVAAAVAVAVDVVDAIAVVDAIVDSGKKLEPYSDEWRPARDAAYKAARDEMTRQINESNNLADFRKLRDEQDGAALRILDKLITADEYRD